MVISIKQELLFFVIGNHQNSHTTTFKYSRVTKLNLTQTTKIEISNARKITTKYFAEAQCLRQLLFKL